MVSIEVGNGLITSRPYWFISSLPGSLPLPEVHLMQHGIKIGIVETALLGETRLLWRPYFLREDGMMVVINSDDNDIFNMFQTLNRAMDEIYLRLSERKDWPYECWADEVDEIEDAEEKVKKLLTTKH